MEYGYREPPSLYHSEADASRSNRGGYVPMFHEQQPSGVVQPYLAQHSAVSSSSPPPSSVGFSILPVSTPSVVSNEIVQLPPTPAHRQITVSSRPRQFHFIQGLYVPELFSSDDDPVDYSLLTPDAVLVCRTSVVNSRSNEQVTYLRKKIAEYSGGLSHIELAFKLSTRDGRRPQYWSCSSRQDRVVEFLERDIMGNAYNQTKGEWRCDELTLTEEQRQRAWVYSQTQCGKPYNKWGLYAFMPKVKCPSWFCGWTCFSPRCFFECFCPGVSDGSRLMCSQLVLDTLAFTFANNDAQKHAIAVREPSHTVNPGSALQYIFEMNIMSQVAGTMVDPADIEAALRREFGGDMVTYSLTGLMSREKGV